MIAPPPPARLSDPCTVPLALIWSTTPPTSTDPANPSFSALPNPLLPPPMASYARLTPVLASLASLACAAPVPPLPSAPWPGPVLGLRGGASGDGSASDGGDGTWWREDEDLPPSPYGYVPPSALDRFGGSPQIRNASQAAAGPRAGGTAVVAAIASASSSSSSSPAVVVCCSLRRRRAGVRRQRAAAVHVVSCEEPVPGATGPEAGPVAEEEAEAEAGGGGGTSGGVVALAASGVRPDLTLLLSLLRSRSVEAWDRYDVPPGPASVAGSASQAFLSFLGHDRTREAGDGLGPLRGVDGDGEAFRMSRPFGLDVLVLGVGWGGIASEAESVGGASVRSVDPSGTIGGPYAARAVGRGSDRANELLAEGWRAGMDEAEVEDLCVRILREIARDEMGIGTATDGDGDGARSDGGHADESGKAEADAAPLDGWDLVCERLSSSSLTGLVSKRM